MVNMILAREINGEMWIKASDHNQAVKQAVEVEREACAKLMDEMAVKDKITNYYKVAANSIRARGQE